MERYERIAVLEGMARTKRVELELIEAELKRLRDQNQRGFEQFKAEIKDTEDEEPVLRTVCNTGRGIRL